MVYSIREWISNVSGFGLLRCNSPMSAVIFPIDLLVLVDFVVGHLSKSKPNSLQHRKNMNPVHLKCFMPNKGNI